MRTKVVSFFIFFQEQSSKKTGPGHTAAGFGLKWAERCSFHGYCSEILLQQREARRSEKPLEGRLFASSRCSCRSCSALAEWERMRGRAVSVDFFFFVKRTFSEQLLIPKLLEIEKEIVREVAWGDKPYLRKSTDREAQISPLNWTNAVLICALRSVDFLR